MTTVLIGPCSDRHSISPHIPATKERSRPTAAHRMALACTCVCLLCTFAGSTTSSEAARDTPAIPDSAVIENTGSPVEIDGKPILFVYAQIGGFTPQDRADAIQHRIVTLSDKRNVPIEAIHAEERGTWTEILAGSDRIMGVTESDAKAAERPREQLAVEYAEIIRLVVKQYREDHSWRHYWWGVFYTVLATASLSGLLIVLSFIRNRARDRMGRWLARQGAKGPAISVVLRLSRYLEPPFSAIFRLLFWIIVLGLVQTYVAVVLRFFPSTRYTSYRITNWLFSELAVFGKNCVRYIPNLLLILFICLVTSYLIKLNQYIFREISDQRVTIRGFYPDWAEPTAKLVRVLIIAGAAIAVFPYLPGSQSPAFKGISVFLGVLLSFGSTSAVAHGVAGTILTYMRSFQLGDFVRIGDDVGEVIEKTLLVTRICTQKKEVVTIPNGTVLGGVVINYSAEARQKGVIFHTTVTIGYNAPWRHVHELLVSAALETEDVLRDPAPFVVQTALNDFYVAYELNAYTVHPKNMQNIYSALHQNIQDKFNEARVEINSPHYVSLRDGNRTTIPDAYLPHNYKSPVFEVQEASSSQTAVTGVKNL
jgi:small-conductance mechanosensitive channel